MLGILALEGWCGIYWVISTTAAQAIVVTSSGASLQLIRDRVHETTSKSRESRVKFDEILNDSVQVTWKTEDWKHQFLCSRLDKRVCHVFSLFCSCSDGTMIRATPKPDNSHSPICSHGDDFKHKSRFWRFGFWAQTQISKFEICVFGTYQCNRDEADTHCKTQTQIQIPNPYKKWPHQSIDFQSTAIVGNKMSKMAPTNQQKRRQDTFIFESQWLCWITFSNYSSIEIIERWFLATIHR